MNRPLVISLLACCLLVPAAACAQVVYIPENVHLASPRVPEYIEFAGQTYRFDRPDLYERMDRELINFTYGHTNSTLMLKRADRIFRQIVPILIRNGVPEDLKYLMAIESNLDPKALSTAGAAGLWQFMKATGSAYGLEVGTEVDERYNIEKSTVAACKYLKDSYRKFGSWTLAAAAYNCGNGRISKVLEEQRVDSYYDMQLPEETQRYIFRILALKLITDNPEKYGYQISDNGWYQPYETKTVTVTQSIPNLVDFAYEQGTNYKMLKYYNPWLRSNSLTISAGNSYDIKIPTGKFAKTHGKMRSL